MLYLVAILGVSYVYGADYCAWNRAAVPVDENVGETYNFINGEFVRSFEVSSGGQSDTWHGMPYYKQTNEAGCFQDVLWLYRYKDSNAWPPTYTWVIAASVGTIPVNGYAYCGPEETPTITDLSSPVLCNGKWKVGRPANPATGANGLQATDIFFEIRTGGCPQVNCEQIQYCTKANDIWGTVNGNPYYSDQGAGVSCATYDYDQPNIYKASNTASETGVYYMFFNHRVWKWAASESITGTLNYYNCELYKYGKGFTAVANVNSGDTTDPDPYTPWYTSQASSGGFWYWHTNLDTAQRYIRCFGM